MDFKWSSAIFLTGQQGPRRIQRQILLRVNAFCLEIETNYLGLGYRGSRIGAVLLPNGQKELILFLFFRIILILKRGYRSRLG